MEKVLKLYKVIGGAVTPFPSAGSQIEIHDFKYSSTRMGNAPTITASFMYPSLMGYESMNGVYVNFNGERYYLKGTPDTQYSNEDIRYKYDVTFVSERSTLEHIYFIDTVTGSGSGDVIGYVSHSSKVSFYGDLRQFIIRLNSNLSASGTGYTAEMRLDGYEDKYPKAFEQQLISFEDRYIFNVLSDDCFNAYEVPFFFEGKKIVFADCSNPSSIPTFKYGIENSLLSISRKNANSEIVTRCGGYGSGENIPWYYPNETSTGTHEYTLEAEDEGLEVESIDYNKLALYADIRNGVGDDGTKITLYSANAGSITSNSKSINVTITGGTQLKRTVSDKGVVNILYRNNSHLVTISVNASFNIDAPKNYRLKLADNFSILSTYADEYRVTSKTLISSLVNVIVNSGCEGYSKQGDEFFSGTGGNVTLEFVRTYQLYFDGQNNVDELYISDSFEVGEYRREYPYATIEGKTTIYKLDDIGIHLNNPDLIIDGDTITVSPTILWIEPQDRLMPSIYRSTAGEERFYNAINDEYDKPEGGKYEFENLYVYGKQGEHIESFDDIKPSIANVKNADGEYINQIIDIAFDDSDNDDYTMDGDSKVYKHPYFFVKLRKFSGEHGFNLFDQAIDGSTMQLSFLNGNCTGCKFEIGVDDDTKKNIVQVDAETGELLRDLDGNVRCGREGLPKEKPQDIQNDTRSNEVWIALKKDIQTFGTIMPNKSLGIKPDAGDEDGDEFTILGISLPQSYITAAEALLEAEIIKYMSEHNSEMFTFDIDFSRIFFAEDEEAHAARPGQSVLSNLRDSSKIGVVYPIGADDATELYVTSFDYEMSSEYHLPKISVGLSDEVYVLKASMRTITESVVRRITLTGSNDNQRALSAFRRNGTSQESLDGYVKKDEQDSVSTQMMQDGSITIEKLSETAMAYIESSSSKRITIGDLNTARSENSRLDNGFYTIVNGSETEVGYAYIYDSNNCAYMVVYGALSLSEGSLVVSGVGSSMYESSVRTDLVGDTWSPWILTFSNDAGFVKFGGDVSIEDGDLTIGDFAESGENITGAKITKEGRGTFTNLKSLSLEIYELIYNRINVQEGDTSFADYGTIESITEESGGQLLIGIRERWDGDIQPFQPGDILYGYVNDLEESGVYGMCWMRVVSRENNAIHVVLYDSADTPAGANIDPNEGMLITRWGNAIEPNATSYEQYGLFITYDEATDRYYNKRQNHFYISSDDGRMMELMGVNSPILRMENYAMVSGILPEGLVDKSKPIDQNEPYFYAKGIVVEDFIRVDHRSRIVRMENYLGDWVEGEQYVSTDTYFDTVTYDGKRWQCVSASTYDEPSVSSAAWMLMGKDGEEGVAYRLTTTDSSVHARKNAQGVWEFSASSIGASVARSKESGIESLTTNEAIGRYGLHIEYKKNDGTRDTLALGDICELSVMVGGVEHRLTTDDGYILETEGTKIEVDDTVSNIRLYLVNRRGEDIDEISVPILKDGENGSKGALMYQAGKWQSGITYTATKDTWPIVLYQPAGSDGTYYYLPSIGDEPRTSTGQEPSSASSPWELVEQFSVIFTNALFADFGKLGDWVFYGNYMFSKYGDLMGDTDDTVVASNIPYNDGDAIAHIRDHGIGRKANKFCPNWWANAETGETYMGNATVDGSLVSRKMTVTFNVIPNFEGSNPTGPFIDVNPNNGFNYIVKDRSALGGTGTPKSAGVLFLCMPDNRNNGWAQAGTQCVIVHDGTPSMPPTEDNVILTAGSLSQWQNPTFDDDGWFLWKGQKTKFIYLAPGMYVRLVSVNISVKGSDNEYHNHIYWLVENASDFEPFDAVIDVAGENDDIVIGYSTEYGGTNYHKVPILGNSQYSAITFSSAYSFEGHLMSVQSYLTVSKELKYDSHWWGVDPFGTVDFSKVIRQESGSAGTPTPTVRPAFIGQICIITHSQDSSRRAVYLSSGNSIPSWILISSNWIQTQQ